MEMLLLKQHLTPILWDDLSNTAELYWDHERWADEAVRLMQERGFSCLEAETCAGVIVRFSYESITELAGAPDRPLAVARAIAAILSRAEGFELLTGIEGLTLLTA